MNDPTLANLTDAIRNGDNETAKQILMSGDPNLGREINDAIWQRRSMDRYSIDWATREFDPTERRVYLINPVASASSYNEDGEHLVHISWVRTPDDWFAAWTAAGDKTGKYRRAPRLDAVDREMLGQLIGEVVTPGCLHYGENGMLDPII